MQNALAIAVLAVATAVSIPGASADGSMTFSWTAQEVCLGGSRGSFTPGGDVTNFVNQTPAVGSGTITSHPAGSAAVETGSWMYFLPMPFNLGQPPQFPPLPQPQGVFPVRTSAGQCILIYQAGDGGSAEGLSALP